MFNKTLLLLFSISLCVYGQDNNIQNDELILCNINEKDEIIHLEKSGLENIQEEFVTSDKIKCLNLQDNKLKEIKKNTLNNLPNLQYVNLTGNKLNYTNIFDDNNNEFSNIKTLILDKALTNDKLCKNNDNNICDKELLLKTKLSKLKYLYLRKNNLTSLFINSWIDKVPNLTHLYLSYNQLTTVDFMSDVSCTLTHLYIDNNQIDLFINANIENLIELVMDNNRIYTLCGADDQCAGGILNNANKLEKLSLSNVQLSYIYPTAMNDLINLLELDLSHNHIQNLEDTLFNNSINIKILKLHNNKLLAVPNFCPLINLEILTLNNNDISYIDHQQFSCNMSNLKQLFLNNNQIKFVSSGAFFNMINLELLDLSDNKLQSLSTNWINQENNLQYLNLNNNLFTNTTSMRLDNLKKLQVLNIAGNPLQKITVKSFKYLPENTIVDVMQDQKKCY